VTATDGALIGRTAIITGAAGGIGSASAERFARAGARLVLADVDAERGVALEQRLRDAGGDAVFVAADVRDESAIDQVVEAARRWSGRIDVLFHVAGGSGRRHGDGPVDRCSPAGWDWTLDLNLRSAFLCARAVVPHMLEGGRGGSIVFTSSVQGLVGGGQWFENVGYVAAKHGLVGLTRAMATYYAGRHLRVNVLCPGTIRTPMSARVSTDPALADVVARLQPLAGGPGEPEDVAEAALFLASDAARFITGVALPVDGGWTAF
jgi:NAD(P)-dependent dehydrogenase (short-subunit alcohol dehydrogenase family)